VARQNPPNIVWILLDALRAQQMSAYGYERPTTPNMDALAETGVLFEQTFVQGINTVNSVPSYLTGRYFATPCVGQFPWRHALKTPPPGEVLFPITLREAGYYTLMVTSHLWFTNETRVWSAFDTPVFIPATDPKKVQASFDMLTAESLRQLEQRPTDKPFFLYFHALDTHFPHDPQPPYDQWIPEGLTGWDHPIDYADRVYLRGIYDGSLRYTDDQVAILLESLRERGLMENTIVVISSDHGEILGEDGKTVDHISITCDEVMWTPLIFAGAGVPQGVRVSALTQNADIVPTLCALAGIESKAEYDGKSLVPLMHDPAAEPVHPFAFTWYRDWPDRAAYVLRAPEWVYEGFTDTFYKTPLPLANRIKIEEPDAGMVAYVEETINEYLAPRLAQYDTLPLTSPSVFFVPIPDKAEPASAYVSFDDRQPDDDKWDLKEGLARTWPTEKAPPLTFSIEVPNGEFNVMMEVNSTMLPGGGPHCVIAYKAETNQNWRVVSSPRLYPEARFGYVELGKYTVTDNRFDITLRQAIPGIAAATVSKFKFTPTTLSGDAASTSADEQTDIDEKLQALGYLN